MVTRHFVWGQEVVTSATTLALRLGESVWVPSEWPRSVGGPECVVMLYPGGDSNWHGYQLRGLDKVGRLLVVHGHHRQPGNLEFGLRSLEGERFEILTRPDDQPVHMVVRVPVFDVHVSGDALSYQATLSLVRGLVEVAAGW